MHTYSEQRSNERVWKTTLGGRFKIRTHWVVSLLFGFQKFKIYGLKSGEVAERGSPFKRSYSRTVSISLPLLTVR